MGMDVSAVLFVGLEIDLVNPRLILDDDEFVNSFNVAHNYEEIASFLTNEDLIKKLNRTLPLQILSTDDVSRTTTYMIGYLIGETSSYDYIELEDAINKMENTKMDFYNIFKEQPKVYLITRIF